MREAVEVNVALEKLEQKGLWLVGDNGEFGNRTEQQRVKSDVGADIYQAARHELPDPRRQQTKLRNDIGAAEQLVGDLFRPGSRLNQPALVEWNRQQPAPAVQHGKQRMVFAAQRQNSVQSAQ